MISAPAASSRVAPRDQAAEGQRGEAVARRSVLQRLRNARAPSVAMPLADQGVISAGTFLFNVALARMVPLGEYGHFALVLCALSLMQAGCASLVFYPLSVRGSGVDRPARLDLVATSLAFTAIVGVPIAAILAITVHRWVAADLLMPTFAMLVAGQFQEATRRGLVLGFRFRDAIPGDALSYFGQATLVILVGWWFGMDLATALWIMALTSSLACLVQTRQLNMRGARCLPITATARDFWSIGHWSLTSNLLIIARMQSLPWLLTAFAGPGAAGSFQLATNVVNITNPIVTGVCNMVPQVAARSLPGGFRAAWRAAWPPIGVGAVLVAGFCAILLAFPDAALGLVYSGRAQVASSARVVQILAAGALFGYVASAACAYLHGVLGGRDALKGDIAATLVMAVAAPPLVHAAGLIGGAVALAFSLAIRACLLGLFSSNRVLQASPDASPALDPFDQQEKPT